MEPPTVLINRRAAGNYCGDNDLGKWPGEDSHVVFSYDAPHGAAKWAVPEFG